MSQDLATIWPNLTGGPVTSDGQGIDALIVLPGQTTLELRFLRPVPAVLAEKGVYTIEGGERITSIAVLEAVKTDDQIVVLTLDRFGDWAPYRLMIAESVWETAHVDPVFAGIDFSFKVACPSDIDCRQHLPGFEKFPALSRFDYQAKDFESFKQAMFDRLPTTIPQWWDRAEADFGIALVDLLAYAADRISYHQDRAACESQLATARARQSVSGHLLLLDYALDPGETARALLHFEVDRDMTIPAGTQVETPALSYEDPVVFTLRESFPAYRDLDRLELYDFSHPSLAIPLGALQATVLGHPEGLAEGSMLLLRQGTEESGWDNHLVKLRRSPLLKKSPDGTKVAVLSWDETYALPWDAALAKSHFLGNIAALDHGKTVRSSSYVDGELADYRLPEGPLGYRDGLPLITVKVDGEVWERVLSLKESLPYHKHYQVIDLDDGRNALRFGDNVNGLQPEQYALIEIESHVGLGAVGNVAAGTLTRLTQGVPGIKTVKNHLPGTGGRDPETEDHGKLWGPKRIREQKRAVTPEDYAKEAMSVPGISRAIARFVWTGSWVTVRVTLDPAGTEEIDLELRERVLEHLKARKMAGYDIQLFPVRYVPLEISMRLCLLETAYRDQVFRDLLSALGNGTGADGVRGFFHPDNWTFGGGVALAALYAATARVQGIECAEVLTFKRLRKPQGDEIANGEIPMQWDEIARLDGDKSFPERGKLDLKLVGGR